MTSKLPDLMAKFFRKVIRVTAWDSPNVKLGMKEIADGLEPSNRVVIPGVLSYAELQRRLATWDKPRQTIGLHAEFVLDATFLLFPPDWLNRAEEVARNIRSERQAKAIGCDPGEGGDKTCWSVIDELGLIELVSVKTPNTAVVPSVTLALMKRHGIKPENVAFDRGGGGKEHADRLRAQGFPVRTVAFGESIMREPKRGITLFAERKEEREDRYAYKNRRAEMYGELSLLLDPDRTSTLGLTVPSLNCGFGIPSEHVELRRQLALMPKLYDEEGRMWLPPKNKKDRDSKTKTLTEIIGHSPDEADSLVLAVHALTHKPARRLAGVF